jgi:uncharacterized membrane protein
MMTWIDANGWRIAAGFLIALIVLIFCCTTVPDKTTNRRINTFGALVAFVLGLIVTLIPGRSPGETSTRRRR